MTLSEIEDTLKREIGERENFCRNTFVSLRSGKASKVDANMLTRYLTEIRCLKNTLKTFKKGG